MMFLNNVSNLTNNPNTLAQVINTGAVQHVQNGRGVWPTLVADNSSEKYDAGMRAKELDTIYRVLKGQLSRKQRQQSWRKWRPVLSRYPLTNGTPFINVINFVNEIARENDFDIQKKLVFRSELLRSLVKDSGYGNKNALPTNITLKSGAHKILYKSSEMTKYENASIGIDATSHLVLMTKRRMVVGTSVMIQFQKRQVGKNSALHISSHVARIDLSKSGSYFEYVIEENKSEQTLVA